MGKPGSADSSLDYQFGERADYGSQDLDLHAKQDKQRFEGEKRFKELRTPYQG